MIKADIPLLRNRPDLVYLDSAATTQKPDAVIDAMTAMYTHQYATVHRGVYRLSAESTAAYAKARRDVAAFVNAKQDRNIVFTKGTTDGINLVARGFVRSLLQPGDTIVVSAIEHHANMVPWQMMAKEAQARVVYVPVDSYGHLDMVQFQAALTDRTRFVALTQVSNALGSVFPVDDCVRLAKSKHIPILIDGAQAIAHDGVDLHELDPDFYCFSGHKMYGPTGIGVCYMNDRVIDRVAPITFGGDMIERVTHEATTFAKPPIVFEAGTPAIVEAIGLGAAVAYIQSVGLPAIQAHERDLTNYAYTRLSQLDFLQLYGPKPAESPIISFNVRDVHPHDVGSILDQDGIAIRVGHHCSQPTMAHLQVVATARVSLAAYNTMNDIDRLCDSLHRVQEVFLT
jgi:cysteine desulfurase/selenocysteine lyase